MKDCFEHRERYFYVLYDYSGDAHRYRSISWMSRRWLRLETSVLARGRKRGNARPCRLAFAFESAFLHSAGATIFHKHHHKIGYGILLYCYFLPEDWKLCYVQLCRRERDKLGDESMTLGKGIRIETGGIGSSALFDWPLYLLGNDFQVR